MLRKVLTISFSFCLLCTSTLLFADSYFCTKNNQYVNTGDTLGQVLSTCGPPTHTSTRTITKAVHTKPSVISTWVYPNHGISIVFSGERVISIDWGNKSASYTRLCSPASYVVVGMSSQRVQTLCGKPFRIISANKETKKIAAIIWQYQTNSTIPPESLVFRDGKLYSVGS